MLDNEDRKENFRYIKNITQIKLQKNNWIYRFIENHKLKKIYHTKFKYSSMELSIRDNILKLLDLFSDRQFIPESISAFIQRKNLHYAVYTYHNINIYVCYDEKINIGELFTIINIICKINKIEMKDFKLELYFVLSDLKKVLPNGKYFLADNANSGYSIRGKIICIFRKEEYIKVLFHELVHYFRMDYYVDNNVNSLIKNKFAIRHDIYFSECVTELKTIILNSIYISLKYELDALKILKMELKFSLFQAAKIFLHQSKYTRDLPLRNIFIYQKTHIFAYYILKSYLLFHILKRDIDVFEKEINYFMELNKINYVEIDGKILEIIKIINSHGKYSEIDNTMRMSLF